MLAFNFMGVLAESMHGDWYVIGELIYSVFSSVIGVAAYVLTAVALYTIAKNRGIKNGWLAWLPLGASWILGSISDQYQYVVKGKNKSKRVALLILEALVSVTVFVFFLSLFVPIFQLIFTYGTNLNVDDMVWIIMQQMGSVLLTLLVMIIASVAYTVVSYIALFDIYRSCSNSSAELFLLLSIFVGITRPVLLFINRNKEEGMPPRKGSEPIVEAVVAPEETPAEEPVEEAFAEETTEE